MQEGKAWKPLIRLDRIIANLFQVSVGVFCLAPPDVEVDAFAGKKKFHFPRNPDHPTDFLFIALTCQISGVTDM